MQKKSARNGRRPSSMAISPLTRQRTHRFVHCNVFAAPKRPNENVRKWDAQLNDQGIQRPAGDSRFGGFRDSEAQAFVAQNHAGTF
ncbi:hypothetical protein [Paraburkholderia tropica]|uniref:hypothetical protein n=1 Tax=Paraburkholderia tropica TaxID=92647 RepID=UPI001CC61418|nr:hypothetical protein [Paraburkholderia tropica]